MNGAAVFVGVCFALVGVVLALASELTVIPAMLYGLIAAILIASGLADSDDDPV